jgi:hypothetical protein
VLNGSSNSEKTAFSGFSSFQQRRKSIFMPFVTLKAKLFRGGYCLSKQQALKGTSFRGTLFQGTLSQGDFVPSSVRQRQRQRQQRTWIPD